MKLSLGQLFAAVLAAVATVVAIGFVLFVRTAERSALATAKAAHEQVASQVHEAIVAELGRALQALDRVDRGENAGAISTRDDAALEAAFLVEMLGDDHLAEVTFTGAKLRGYERDGDAVFAAEGRRQVSVVRAPDGGLSTRVTKSAEHGAGFEAFGRTRLADAPLRIGPAPDPTKHATFATLVLERFRGKTLWSDLHYAEHDADLPAAQRRVVLTVQRRIDSESGVFVGVVRVGLVMKALDDMPRRIVERSHAPYTIALYAFSSGKPPRPGLVARLDPSDHIALEGDDLRVVASRPPPALVALTQSPFFKKLDPEHPNADGTLDVGGARHLAVLREVNTELGGTSGWFVAVLGPESHYTGQVRALERRLAVGFGITLLIIVAMGALAVRAIRRGLGRAVASTARMRAFDFSPAPQPASRLREIHQLVSGLERAKTVARAMGKYIPVELVRDLYATNAEPKLGGKLAEISIMFTDIEGFTTLAEKLPPDQLAQRLGEYLEAMTRAITSCDGTIDKYIGDAVMAFWNAPSPVAHHATQACRAALAAMKTAAALFSSPAWDGLPPLVTRFGIHKATVMVGHFGAPSRLSYTALGDGVNLAARLEPLCKQYGVIALASEDVVAEAKSSFVFRRIDRVAVKGKSKCIDVYELLGEAGADLPNRSRAKTYEQALALYLARDFAAAIALLEPQATTDPPSAVLLDRCRALAETPPPADWSGVFVATSK